MDSIEKLNAAITLIEEARGVPLSASCVVHRGEILEILDGARVALPTDLDQAIEIISSRDLIIEEARTSADHLIATAREDVSRMVEQTAIVQSARDEAQRILDDARALADEERAEVAREIHDLGEGVGPREFLPEQGHEAEDPEGPGARAEEAVVETERKPEGPAEEGGVDPRLRRLRTQPRAQGHVDHDGEQHPWDDPSERVVPDQGERPRSGHRAEERERGSQADLRPADQPGTGVAAHGDDRAAGALRLVGAERELRRQAGPE